MPSTTPSSAPLGPGQDRAEITSRKVVGLPEHLDPADDSLPVWTERYLDLAVRGVRSAEVTAKISGTWSASAPGSRAASGTTGSPPSRGPSSNEEIFNEVASDLA
ncbi:hypothetical protein [Streptosporangium canum]|uniref:hypothetical protein n=1 Tax=Streptosporangium canum TaxID=324952 RepID=UPI0033B857CC